MPIFLGLDCGGSSIRALATDADGNRVFSGQAGAGNIATLPPEVLARNLRKATEGCAAPDAVCGCFAGLLTEGQKEAAETLLQEMFRDARVEARADFHAILRAEPEADICVIAGTGSLVCSIRNGVVAKSGGRGYLLGDVGSAQAFGKDGLIHYLNAPERASTALVEAVEETFHSSDEQEILACLYKSPSPAALMARLAKPLASDYEAGEPYALQSVEKNSGELGEIIKRHIATYLGHPESVRIALAGGLWKSSGIFKQSFVLHLSGMMTDLNFNVEVLKRAPVEGAANLAREMPIGY